MFALLSWLWDRASRVYEFFGTLYARIRDAALSAYSWARQAASDAYNWAKDYLLPKIAEAATVVRSYAIGLFGIASDLIDYLRENTLAWVNAAKVWAEGKARSLVQGAIDYIQAVKSDVIHTLYDVRGQLETWVRGLLGPLETEIGSLSTLDQRARPVLAVLEGSNLGKIADFLDRGYAFVSTFIANPIATLWAMVEPYLSDLASYYLGYALGAVNRTLAPPPTLIGNAYIGDGGGGIGPPPGAGRLARPVDPLYISGYTFGNPSGHEGVDFGLDRGQAVYAAHDGVVETARDLGDGYALCVTIRGGDWWSRYAHLMAFYVHEGDQVRAQEPIAAGNSTGNSTGDHLHFAVKYKGQYIDPMRVL